MSEVPLVEQGRKRRSCQRPPEPCAAGTRGESSFLTVHWSESTINNLLVRIHDDFSRSALRHGGLNSLFLEALYLPSCAGPKPPFVPTPPRTPPPDLTVGLCLGIYGGPRGVVSFL